jgi:hypothetical protein
MITSATRLLIAAEVLFELAKYDLVNATFGFRRIHATLARLSVRAGAPDPDATAVLPDVVRFAMCFYWKPVLCLQRSVVTARMLRNRGVDARLVIGYRPSPFFSHAWVEVDGRVVNDSPAYKQRLRILCTT